MSLLPTMGQGYLPLPFNSTIQTHLKTSNLFSKGFVTEDCKLCVSFCGKCLEVINPQTGERLAAWTFVSEITQCMDMAIGECSYLGVGLNDGQVCVFDIRKSCVIRCIDLTHRITSMCQLDQKNTNLGPRFLSEELLIFHGLLAIGTQEGHVYLIDFAMDEQDYASDESNMSQAYFYDINLGGAEKIAQVRATALGLKRHVCIPLNDSVRKRPKVFDFTDNVVGETTYFPEAGVVVSALKFVPQIGGLLVGFNFGAWQLWNISAVNSRGTPLGLEFSSEYISDALPVISFAFQEPENDPRNFTYVWAIRGENDLDSREEKDCLKNNATITLYALAFQNRDDCDAGVLYTGLTACHQRFQHSLVSPEENVDTTGSLCLSSATLVLGASNFGLEKRNMSEAEAGQINLGLCTFLWEVVHADDGVEPKENYFLGIFDLNAWYQAQMPGEVEVEPGTQCSYFSICSLNDVFPEDDHELGNMIDCRIDLTTLSRYHSHLLNMEQHFYPSSLAFNVVCLLEKAVVHATHLGLQRKVLLEMRSQGRDSIVDPRGLYDLCRVAGLVEQNAVDESETDLKLQRCAILTVALEHHFLDFLKSCLLHWHDGKYSDVDCTFNFFMDWTWNRVVTIKQNIDKDTLPLFDEDITELAESVKQDLVSQSRQLEHLKTLILEGRKLTNRQNNFSTMAFSSDELELKSSIASLIKLYVDAILWFFNAGLLPEKSSPNIENAFPAAELAQDYNAKRNKFKLKMNEWLDTNKQIGVVDYSGPSLLVDSICQHLGPSLQANFEREGGDGRYPPPTLHALLISYLIKTDDKNINLKHRLIQYIFLDMASCLSKKEEQTENELIFVENLIKFPSAFSVPPSIIKLTQAFWLLDNEDFEEALAMLLDPLVQPNDITDNEHRSILVTFLIHDRPKLSLKYANMRKPPTKSVTDVQLQIAILLANGMVHEAFEYMRVKRNQNGCETLMKYFLNKAEKLGKLDIILQMTLTLNEDRNLVDFLNQSVVHSSKEVLMEYYLQRARYAEAKQLNDQLSKRQAGNSRSTHTRQSIIDRYSKLIPSMTSKTTSYRYSHVQIQPSHFTMLPTIEVSKGDENNQPVFNADIIESRSNSIAKSVLPTQNYSMTPFRPRSQRIGLFHNTDHPIADKQPKSPAAPTQELFSADDRLRSVDFHERKTPTKQEPKMDHIFALLTTPVPSARKDKASYNAYGLHQKNESRHCHTPQSILKVKRILQNEDIAGSPSLPKSDECETDVEQDWTRPLLPRSRESTPGKSLRFNVPKKLPPLDESLMNQETSKDESEDVVFIDDNDDKETDKSQFDQSKEETEEEEKGSSCSSDIIEIVEEDQQEKAEPKNEEDSELQLEYSGSVVDEEDEEEKQMKQEAYVDQSATSELDVSVESEVKSSSDVQDVDEDDVDDMEEEDANEDLDKTESLESSDVEQISGDDSDEDANNQNVTVALTPSSRKSLISDILKARHDTDEDDEKEEEEEDDEQPPDSSMTSAMSQDYLSQSGSSHERTLMLTESGRKSLVLEVLKDNQKFRNQLESEEDIIVEEKEEVEDDQDHHQDQVETKESVEEEIEFDFSPPDEQTVSLSQEVRQSLAQTLARQEERVYEVSTGTGEFTFTNPENIALSPPADILSSENEEPDKEEEDKKEEQHLEPKIEVEVVLPKQNESELLTNVEDDKISEKVEGEDIMINDPSEDIIDVDSFTSESTEATSQDDDDEPKPSHEKTILLTESDRKSLILDVLKKQVDKDDKIDVATKDQDQGQTTVSPVEDEEEEISFNFSAPDEQTVSISAEMRKNLAQNLVGEQAAEEEQVCEFQAEEFTFTNPDSIVLSPSKEIKAEEKESEEESNSKNDPTKDFIDGTITQKQEDFELQLEEEEVGEEEGKRGEENTSTSIVETYHESSIDTDLPLDTTIALTPSSRKSLIFGIVSESSTLDTKEREDDLPPTSDTSKDEEEKISAEQDIVSAPTSLDAKQTEDFISNTNVPSTSETSKVDDDKTTVEQGTVSETSSLNTREIEDLSNTNAPPTLETSKDEEEKTPAEQELSTAKSCMRKRRPSAVPKLDVIDEDNTTAAAETKSAKEITPLAPTEDSTEQKKPVVEDAQLLEKNDDTSLMTPLRRSRRRLSSQSSDSEGEMKSTSRKNTPISSSSKKRSNLKKVAMEPLIEDEGEAKEQSSTMSKAGRKRRLSAVPQLDIISEEVTTGDQESSPRKSKKESDDDMVEKRLGRARKNTDRYSKENEITTSSIKRTPGRPRKNQIPMEEENSEVVKDSDKSIVKKRPGQYLEESETSVSPIKKTPGRSRKTPIHMEKTPEVIKDSDIGVVKNRSGQYLEKSETTLSPIKRTPGRPRKNPIPVEKTLEFIKESDISEKRSSRKSVSTSSVPQAPEAPSVTRSRSHSSTTTLEVIKESDTSVVKKTPGRPRKNSIPAEKTLEVIRESDISDTSVVRRTPGRPRKNPIPKEKTLEVIKESDILDTRSSRKSVSTSSVSQHPEAPSVTRSRSHSSATTLEVSKESNILEVKKRPGRTRKISENEEKSQPKPFLPSRKSVTSEKSPDKTQEIPSIKTPSTRSSRKSVSTSSVSQYAEAPPVTRSRSHSSTTKVLDTMFTPVKTKPSRITGNATTEDTNETQSRNSRRQSSRRYSVKIQKKSHKI